jgi:hypothetical protein
MGMVKGGEESIVGKEGLTTYLLKEQEKLNHDGSEKPAGNEKRQPWRPHNANSFHCRSSTLCFSRMKLANFTTRS